MQANVALRTFDHVLHPGGCDDDTLADKMAGGYLSVYAWSLFRSMVEVVLIPLLAGLLINTGTGSNAQA